MSSFSLPKWEVMGGCVWQGQFMGSWCFSVVADVAQLSQGQHCQTAPAREPKGWSCRHHLSLAAVSAFPVSVFIPYLPSFDSPELLHCFSIPPAAQVLFLRQYMKEMIWPFSSSVGAAGIQTTYFPLWILQLFWKLVSQIKFGDNTVSTFMA